MKQAIVASLLILLMSNAQAQTTKGSWLLGGNVNFSHSQNNNLGGLQSTTFDYEIAPKVGYFFFEKVAGGLKASYDRSGYKVPGMDGYDALGTANFGPFARYYFLSPQKPLNILVEGSYQFGFTQGSSDKKKYAMNTLAVSGGPVVYLNSAVGVEFLVGYSTSRYVDWSGRNNSLQVGLGLQVHLNRGK